MRKTVASVAVAFSGVVLGMAQASAAPNQGDAAKVLDVVNPEVSCPSPVPAEKVDVPTGATISVTSVDPIAYVSVKSGEGAYIVSSVFLSNEATITVSKDVSNYVVWTCPVGGGDF